LLEALARSHNDSILSRPARSAGENGRWSAVRAMARWLRALPPRSIAGAALVAILIGIVVNALALQKEHRPATFAAARPALQPSAPPAAAANSPQAASQPDSPAAEPPPRSTKPGASSEAAGSAPARFNDPIRDLLRADAGKDVSHLTLEAQNALVKLGYGVKADGVAGAATIAAIQQFEHAHSLASSSEVTPRLLRQLSAAAAAAN
jgi:Putative peptidoglycan binding domain